MILSELFAFCPCNKLGLLSVQMQRVAILRSLMTCKNIIIEDGSGIVDLDDIAMKTEGYLPRDLNLLLDRAIHASAVHNRGNDNTQGKH